jgi:Na+-transporting methylmalonyl-CoA/oxaloacetate decarboxylase gamma subunit
MLFKLAFASLATGPSETPMYEALGIVLLGFSFVFCVLLILSFTTSVLGKIFARLPFGEPLIEPLIPSHAKVTTTAEEPTVASGGKGGDSDIEESDPRYIAVIAAAIHCVVNGRKHRIVSIHSSDSNWAAEGRRQIFSSHKVR